MGWVKDAMLFWDAGGKRRGDTYAREVGSVELGKTAPLRPRESLRSPIRPDRMGTNIRCAALSEAVTPLKGPVRF
jgi:hypothetical protein